MVDVFFILFHLSCSIQTFFPFSDPFFLLFLLIVHKIEFHQNCFDEKFLLLSEDCCSKELKLDFQKKCLTKEWHHLILFSNLSKETTQTQHFCSILSFTYAFSHLICILKLPITLESLYSIVFPLYFIFCLILFLWVKVIGTTLSNQFDGKSASLFLLYQFLF